MTLKIVFLPICLCLAFFVGACTGPDTKKDNSKTKEKQTLTKGTIKADKPPTKEELSKAPCGNPDWDNPPPGFKQEELK